jgi:hypothetical protein
VNKPGTYAALMAVSPALVSHSCATWSFGALVALDADTLVAVGGVGNQSLADRTCAARGESCRGFGHGRFGLRLRDLLEGTGGAPFTHSVGRAMVFLEWGRRVSSVKGNEAWLVGGGWTCALAAVGGRCRRCPGTAFPLAVFLEAFASAEARAARHVGLKCNPVALAS